MFSDEDVEEGWKAWRSGAGVVGPEKALREAMRRVMIRAIELVAARGGTMTAEEIAALTRYYDHLADTLVTKRLLVHIATLGARVAVLEAENSTYGKAVDSLTHVVEKDQQHISELEKSLENARKERDDLQAQVDAGVRIQAEVTRDMTRIQRERDSALADNAALLMFVAPLAEVACEGVGPEECGECVSCMAKLHVAQPHPGAALAERAKRLEEDLENVKPFEALHADLSEQLRAAWEATGVAGMTKGVTTLADVVGVQRADLLSAQERADAAEKVLSELADIIRAHVAKRKREAH